MTRHSFLPASADETTRIIGRNREICAWLVDPEKVAQRGKRTFAAIREVLEALLRPIGEPGTEVVFPEGKQGRPRCLVCSAGRAMASAANRSGSVGASS